MRPSEMPQQLCRESAMKRIAYLLTGHCSRIEALRNLSMGSTVTYPVFPSSHTYCIMLSPFRIICVHFRLTIWGGSAADGKAPRSV